MVKTILITGASRGIGLATSIQLVNAGYTVIGIARTESKKYPGILFKCDLGDVRITARTLEEIKGQYKIDAMINNVGIVMPEPLGEISLDSLSKVYDLNVRAAVQVTQAFIDIMKSNGAGRIVNISSRAILGSSGLSNYSAAKNALIGLTRSWALELAQYNITVNAIAPGFIETELFHKQYPINSTKEVEAIKCTPLGRIGKPEEIAATILFLLSDDAGFMTGQTLFIDGGRSL
ncbi:MAG: short chain dehydrogenase [Burkholderiales bacterium]|jgi:NAD(P)-dependent dehydrogenase (short-subunit alcohol dehydrogenase family)|nr:short chain dehydrogenase [Burkholderiales bacterium]